MKDTFFNLFFYFLFYEHKRKGCNNNNNIIIILMIALGPNNYKWKQWREWKQVVNILNSNRLISIDRLEMKLTWQRGHIIVSLLRISSPLKRGLTPASVSCVRCNALTLSPSHCRLRSVQCIARIEWPPLPFP